jgi:deoxycytidylate deaminase
LTIIVLRADDAGNYKNSRPCAQCIQTLKKFGIQRVIYSNDEGGFTQELVENMDKENAFVSYGWKKIHLKNQNS